MINQVTGDSSATGHPVRSCSQQALNNTYRAIAASVTSIVYGNSLADKNLDEFLEHIFEVVHRLSNAAGKDKYMVEYVPSMLLLPDWMAKWKRDAAAFFQQFTAFFEGLYEDTRPSMVRFIATESSLVASLTRSMSSARRGQRVFVLLPSNEE